MNSWENQAESFAGREKKSAAAPLNTPARASTVNRTRRVVQERAKVLQAQRSRQRSMWIPLALCSAFTLIFCYAVWTVLEGYELTPDGIVDSSDQLFVLLIWFLPVSAAVLAAVWFRRSRNRSDEEIVK